MLEAILNVFGVICLTISGIYIWSFLLGKKINFKDYKFYIFVPILMVLSLINYATLLKFTVLTIYMSLFVKFIFKVDYRTSLVTVVCTQTLNIILEIIFSFIIIFIMGVNFNFEDLNTLIIVSADIFISLGTIFIFKINFFQSLHKTLIKLVEKIDRKKFLIILILITFIFNIYIQMTYYKINSILIFLLNNISTYVIIAIILILAKKENEYIKIYDKYNTTLNSLKEYEGILDKYRISNHENKNQLLTIRNMIPVRNKKIINYIDELVKNQLKDDERIMHEVSIIPAGGLRGLVYSKVLYMNQNKIDYELNISKEIRTVDIISKLEDSDILDICKIIGVYIDNAIEAVSKLEEKYISIDLYLQKRNLVFEISNYYDKKIELDKLDQSGYTTKGSGHGYGLTLASEIINSNKKLQNERKISKEIFTQILRIKMN